MNGCFSIISLDLINLTSDRNPTPIVLAIALILTFSSGEQGLDLKGIPRTRPNLCILSVDSAFLWKRKIYFLFGSNIHLADTVRKEGSRALGERPGTTGYFILQVSA